MGQVEELGDHRPHERLVVTHALLAEPEEVEAPPSATAAIALAVAERVEVARISRVDPDRVVRPAGEALAQTGLAALRPDVDDGDRAGAAASFVRIASSSANSS